jgi:heavy metal translocating P-type ATPase
MNQACDYCGLPVRGRVADGPCYCCSGCRFASSITGAGGADGQARWMMTCLGLAAFFSMNVMVFTFFLWSEGTGPEGSEQAAVLYDLARYASLVFTVPVLFLLGGPLVESAIDEARRGRVSIDCLLVAGVAASFAISAWATWQGAGHVYFEVACMVLLAVTLGRWFEASGKLQTTAALRDLESLLPDRVRRVRAAAESGGNVAGAEQEVLLADVAVGDMLRILPGEQVPVDARIQYGRAEFDERTVSGESEPVVRGPGDVVRSGTTNLDGEVVIAATAPPGAGTLEQLIAAVNAAVGASATQRMADRIATWFLPAVLVVGAITCGFHWWQRGFAAGVLAGLAVVVVSCPCALGLATPMALWAAIGRCMRRQVLVRDGDAIEKLAGVKVLCLDKTGTLTTGCRVERIEVAEDVRHDTVLALAAGLARGSTHVTAAAIADTADAEAIAAATISDARSVAGSGVEGLDPVTGQTVRLGSRRWIEDVVGAVPAAFSGSRCVLAIGERVVAAFWTAEHVRPLAAAAVAGLESRGRGVVILSGDQPARVAAVADELGVRYEAGLVPTDKLRSIESLKRSGGVAMVGDGINDAAALAKADVGIALGCGADIARWSAPICLLDDDLGHLPWLVDLAGATRRTIRWNLVWAFAYNTACIPLAATGIVHPALAAVAMVASSLLVVGNSLRLGRDEHDPRPARDQDSAMKQLETAEALA